MSQGKVDAAEEISKLEKKRVLAESNKEKLVKLVSQPSYETSVKEEVREVNKDKVGSFGYFFFGILVGS